MVMRAFDAHQGYYKLGGFLSQAGPSCATLCDLMHEYLKLALLLCIACLASFGIAVPAWKKHVSCLLELWQYALMTCSNILS